MKIYENIAIRTSLLLLCSFCSVARAQHEGWHLKDREEDGFWGISLDKAYQFLKNKGRKPHPVVVGVLDSGIDTAHVDLKPFLWTNRSELVGNGVDDDRNGYVDDVHGWSFLGNASTGKNVIEDSFEYDRLYWRYKGRFASLVPSQIRNNEQFLYETWLRAQGEFLLRKKEHQQSLLTLQKTIEDAEHADALLQKVAGKKSYNRKDLGNYQSEDIRVQQFMALLTIRSMDTTQRNDTNLDEIDYLKKQLKNRDKDYKAPINYRSHVGDRENDIKDRYYGSNNIYVNDRSAYHGTHVAGIICAFGNPETRVMPVRVVPRGDEHDKDVALGICYAVDNGAKVINMSFGKDYSPQKKWVDQAVRYAQKKGVLLVHSAGNDGKDLDRFSSYPTPKLLDGKRAENWITVGASGDEKLGGMIPSFTNYGRKEVDLFAPGVSIYSTVPGNGNSYKFEMGTSMAAPVVTGIVALLYSYYPQLNFKQIKRIIEKSVIIPNEIVKVPKSKHTMPFCDLSKTGGIVNAYLAVKMAEAMCSKTTRL